MKNVPDCSTGFAIFGLCIGLSQPMQVPIQEIMKESEKKETGQVIYALWFILA